MPSKLRLKSLFMAWRPNIYSPKKALKLFKKPLKIVQSKLSRSSINWMLIAEGDMTPSIASFSNYKKEQTLCLKMLVKPRSLTFWAQNGQSYLMRPVAFAVDHFHKGFSSCPAKRAFFFKPTSIRHTHQPHSLAFPRSTAACEFCATTYI